MVNESLTNQEKSINKTIGPCLLMAGAGTGKTYTIVKKISKMISGGEYTPSEILCLTFSNEATNSLHTKIEEEIGNSRNLTVKTFHGFCSDIIREFGHLINIDPGFDILLPDDAKVMFHKNMDISPYYANRYISTISVAKDLGITIDDLKKYRNNLKKQFKNIDNLEEYVEKMEYDLQTLHLEPSETVDDRKENRLVKKNITAFLLKYREYKKYDDFIESWKKYEEMKKEKNFLDYSDLNYYALELFEKHNMNELISRFRHVIVDEFQDTNKLQFELLEHLAKEHRNITIVGDPNQSIYGFRGAYRENFNHFKEVFKVDEKKDVFELNKSYRSPNTILRISQELIKNNYEDPNECFLVENFEGREGNKVEVVELVNGNEEARKISDIVEEEIESGVPLNEICVLFRTHAQSKLIKRALESKNIPIVSAGETDLLQRPEIRTVISYLSILNNLRERTGTGEQSWWHLFHYHNTLIPEDSIKIGRFLKKNRDNNISIDEALLNSLDDIKLSRNGKKIVKRVVNKLDDLMKRSNRTLPDLVLDIYEIVGLNRAFSHDRSIENVESMMNLKNFYELAENYYKTHDKNLSSFINYLEVLDKLNVVLPASKIKNINAVRLMTIHAVKGLQFDTVIVSNLADDRFPVTRTRNEPIIPKELNPDIKRYIDAMGEMDEFSRKHKVKEYEKDMLLFEERRLCYVAFTRAKKKLVLTYGRSYNNEEDSCGASIFLNEIKFKENDDIAVISDSEELSQLFAPYSKFEKMKYLLKKQIIDNLDSEKIDSLMSRLLLYYSVREKSVVDGGDISKLVDKKAFDKHIKMDKERCSCVDFDRDNFHFSPTHLITYLDCPKKYELQNILHMPARGAFEWSGASVGSFVHKLLEDGVRNKFSDKKTYLAHALELSKLPEWKGVDLADVNHLVNVFWSRNKSKIDDKSLVEQNLSFSMDGFKFFGIADRIDFLNDNDVEIVDYKTNKQAVDPKKRAIQLGFYAIAVKECMGLNPVKLTLDMLRLEKPVEAIVSDNGDVNPVGRAKGFNIDDVKAEILQCCRDIIRDFEGEFLPTQDDNKCRFCGFKFYCPKWNNE